MSHTHAATIVLTIPGKPTGKERPRFVKHTGHTYTPTGTLLLVI